MAFAVAVLGFMFIFSHVKNRTMSQEPESKTIERHHNRLASTKSPYLLQHAENPVDWYPWGPEAFEKARKENKPIFMSIGYASCHWCHVMERESFEDPQVAKLMNEVFVSILVDREERPDIDNEYMAVSEMLTGTGGWPLNIIMTPDRRPFLAATYIPKESRFGRMGMLQLIPRIKQTWTTRPDEILKSANQISASRPDRGAPGEDLGESTLKTAYEQLAHSFDEQHGGFGGTPKFPTPHNLYFLLRYWKRTGNEKALQMVEKTLEALRQGGIYDQVGFGFHRYSTDSQWLVPHFEKMLYDQALLALAYTEAYQATKKEEYAKTARQIFAYVLRDMTAPTGGFNGAEDADSEGEEGKFYLWTEKQIREVLDPREADLIVKVFGVERQGNFANPAAGQQAGTNILAERKPLAEIAAELKMPEEDLQKRLEAARQKLFAARQKRIHPGKDDKILTDWNGLMIAAFAKGAQAFDEPRYREAAQRAADFVLGNMRNPDGRLLHRYRDGEAAIQANSDDYAFLTWGLLELYETSFELRYLQAALDLNRDLVQHFWDDKNSGFYFTADDAENHLVRQKQIYDGAIPSGNSVAMLNLLRLARMTANPDLEDKAARVGRAFSGTIGKAPSEFTQMMVAVDFAVGPSYEVVIAGNSQAQDTKAMLRALMTPFVPNKIALLRPSEQPSPEIVRLAEFTKYQPSLGNKATAYVCLKYNCKLPTTDISKMLELLDVKHFSTTKPS